VEDATSPRAQPDPLLDVNDRDRDVLRALAAGPLTARDAGTDRDHMRRLRKRRPALVRVAGQAPSTGRPGRPGTVWQLTDVGRSIVGGE
jgi:predicted ArsR family transcriptional regulator